jgi:hypothetical protein
MCETAGDRLIASELFRGINENVHWNPHSPKEPAYLGISLGTGQIRLLDDQKVNIAMGTPFAPCPRAKEDNLFRTDGLCNPGRDCPEEFVISI